MRVCFNYKFPWDEGFEEFYESSERLREWLDTVGSTYAIQMYWPGMSEEDREQYYYNKKLRIPPAVLDVFDADEEFFLMLNLIMPDVVKYY